MQDQRERIFDIGGSKDAGTGRAQSIAQLKCNEWLIFDDEDGMPRKGIDASHDTAPVPLKRRPRLSWRHEEFVYDIGQSLSEITLTLKLSELL